MSADRTLAEQACLYVMGRLFRDPELAYRIGPGSEAFNQLTAAVAAIKGEDAAEYRARVSPQIEVERTVPRSMYDALQRELDELLDARRAAVPA